MTLSRAARAFAPALLLTVLARCSAGELDAEVVSPEASSGVEAEGLEPQPGLELAEEAELQEDGYETGGATELELGQLAQPLVNGSPCSAGTVACLNAGVAQRCVNGRIVSLPCPASTACRNGQCVSNQVCTPNAGLGCSGSARVVCNAAGTGSTIVSCSAGSTCTGTGQCAALPRVCTPNSRTCNGNTLQTCNPQGTALSTTQCTGGFCTTQGCIIIR